MISYNKLDEKLNNIARIAEKHIQDNLTIMIEPSMAEFEGVITREGASRVLKAGSHGQLLYLIGRYARNPQIENGTFRSEKEVCGMYFASHNNNYYEKAPIEEICELIDRMALWGMNTLKMWFDMYFFEDMEDGRAYAERLIAILKYAKSIGVKTVLTILSNEAFKNSPKHLRADWTCGHDGYIYNLNDHYHVEICPSVPGGMEQILSYRRQWLEVFKEAEPDFISIGPYDEGGCSCSACAPWGANGYIKTCEALIPLIKEYLPQTEIILSMWQFGTFTGNDVESEGLKKVLEEGRLPECRYLVAEPQYLKYPYEHGMPRPLIGFPEISMCSTLPWGGYGTNPIPSLLQKIMDENLKKQEGGLPYSEGFYEEINKVIVLRFYRDGQSASDSVREYLAYEFGLSGEALDKLQQAIMDMEETLYRGFEPGHRYPVNKPEKMASIEETVLEVHASLPDEVRSSKQWQMIYLRAVIDGELARNDFKRNEKVLEYFHKIIELCYLEEAGFHVKPDVVDDSRYGRVLTKEELKIIAAGGKLE